MSNTLFSLTAVVSFVVSGLLTRQMIKLAPQIGTLDVASARSSHSGSVPRSGGVGPFAAMCCVLAVVATQVSLGWRGWLVVAAVGAIALVGFIDDLFDLGPAPRLCAQASFGIAVWVALAHDPDRLVFSVILLAAIGAWCIFAINAVNFMDGINGISSTLALLGVACVIGSSIAQQVPDWLVLSAVGFAGAFLGFLPFNVPSAKIFLGDIGSYFLGAVVAVVGVLSARSELLLMAFVAFFSIYTFDVVFTLVSRFRRGENLLDAHRDHLYQRLAAAGWPHLQVDAFVGCLVAAPLVASAGLAQTTLGSVAAWMVFGAIQVATLGFYAVIGLRAKQSEPKEGVLHDA